MTLVIVHVGKCESMLAFTPAARCLIQYLNVQSGESAPAWPPVYGQRRRQQAPQNMPLPMHAAASLRAHAALTGEPWLGDGVSTGRAAQCPALPETALLALQNPFAGAAPGAHGAQPLPSDFAVHSGQQAQQGPTEFEAYLQSLPHGDDVWGNTSGMGLGHMGSKAEGMFLTPDCPDMFAPVSRVYPVSRVPRVTMFPHPNMALMPVLYPKAPAMGRM